jgi:hypothetical protein
MHIERDEAIKLIRQSLKQRSGKTWSVRGDRGTAWGWITITAPPKRQVEYGYMSDEDRAELAALLGYERVEEVHHQGVSIPAGSDYRQEFIDRALGRNVTAVGSPYWD